MTDTAGMLDALVAEMRAADEAVRLDLTWWADRIAAIAALAGQADAERYRWLRRHATGGTIFTTGLPGGSLNCDEPESEWDAAIDAAIAAGGEGES